MIKLADFSDLRALTLWRPWSEAIVERAKPIENRPWPPWNGFDGRLIAIHAGAKYDADGARAMAQSRLFYPSPARACSRGIVGLARIVGCVTESESPWFSGPYGWVLDDVVKLSEPIPCAGSLGLWRVPQRHLEAILMDAAVWLHED